MNSQNDDQLVADVVYGLDEVTSDLIAASEIMSKTAPQCTDRKIAYVEAKKSKIARIRKSISARYLAAMIPVHTELQRKRNDRYPMVDD